MPRRRTGRAEEILDHALRLFAERGYESTSVADIQVAAGMTPGSGALYKHFPSKKSLLEAGIARFVEEGQKAALEVPDAEGSDLRTALRDAGTRVLDALGRDEAALRVAWRDLGAFPDLQRRFVHDRVQVGFRQFAGWVTQLNDQGRADVDDPDATAAVLLSSLAFFRLMEALTGAKPARLSDHRFLDAWVEVAHRALVTGTRVPSPKAT